MHYYYKVFGLDCSSEVQFPAFLSIPKPAHVDFHVRWVEEALPDFEFPPHVVKPFSSYNEREFKYCFPDIADYYIKDGQEIWIRRLSSDQDSILLFFYSNALAALLMQRDLIPFHVSGVLDPEGKAWLFSAPSRTGKSTTALMLEEWGYRVFIDDTCLLSIREGVVHAIPSYPMIRAWKPTLDQQQDKHPDAFQIRAEVEKYGIYFHENFVSEPTPVKGIVFLEMEGNEIKVQTQSATLGMVALGNNIYRRQWVRGMNKQSLEFQTVTHIAQRVPFFKAIRPTSKPSYREFAEAIHTQILAKNE